jgi:hypothetical protein
MGQFDCWRCHAVPTCPVRVMIDNGTYTSWVCQRVRRRRVDQRTSGKGQALQHTVDAFHCALEFDRGGHVGRDGRSSLPWMT